MASPVDPSPGPMTLALRLALLLATAASPLSAQSFLIDDVLILDGTAGRPGSPPNTWGSPTAAALCRESLPTWCRSIPPACWTGSRPRSRAVSEGILMTWVNGELVYQQGAITGKRPGRVLRRVTTEPRPHD